jgi:hypothetical protein
MSSFDECDLDCLDDEDLRRLHHGAPGLLDAGDDLDEADAQACWARDVQAEVALLTNRQPL